MNVLKITTDANQYYLLVVAKTCKVLKHVMGRSQCLNIQFC